MAKIIDKAVYVAALGINKSLEQAIIDGDLAGSGTPDATDTIKGKIKLAGDLGGTADSPTVPALANKADLNSPTFTGTPTAPTPTLGDNSSQIPNTSWVNTAISNATSGGGTPLEVFNCTVTIASNAATITGLAYFTAPVAKSVSYVRLQVFQLGGVTSGLLSVDIKKNTTPDDVGMTSMFSAVPTINFSTASNYSTDSGTLSTVAIAQGEVLRLDVTSIPSGWSGSFQITVYA